MNYGKLRGNKFCYIYIGGINVKKYYLTAQHATKTVKISKEQEKLYNA